MLSSTMSRSLYLKSPNQGLLLDGEPVVTRAAAGQKKSAHYFRALVVVLEAATSHLIIPNEATAALDRLQKLIEKGPRS
jgi:hypothetical protein